MEFIRQHILSVLSIAVLCALGQEFAGGHNGAVKLVSGMMIIIAVLAPIVEIEEISVDNYLSNIALSGDWAIAEGDAAAFTATSEYIKKETEAYILSKASDLGAQLKVDVELSKEAPLIPVRISLNGDFSPYTKVCLSNYICQDLGIEEENQIWIS